IRKPPCSRAAFAPRTSPGGSSGDRPQLLHPVPKIPPMKRAFRLVAATGIHRGDREYQQDQVVLLPHPRAHGCVLGVVADGMGGRSGGRKASDQVMLTARQLFERYSPETDDAGALLGHIAQESHIVI